MDEVRGFTLIELMFVVALVAIGTVIAVPSLRSMIHNNRAAAQANELVSALNFARSEAVKRGGNVSVCARPSSGDGCSGTDWAQGWLVIVDTDVPGTYTDNKDKILKIFPPLSANSTLTQTQGFVSFGANGFLDPNINSTNLTFTLTVYGCSGDEKRQISVNLQGRIAVERKSC